MLTGSERYVVLTGCAGHVVVAGRAGYVRVAGVWRNEALVVIERKVELW